MSERKSRELPATAPPHLRNHQRGRNGLPPLPEVRRPAVSAPLEVKPLGSAPVAQPSSPPAVMAPPDANVIPFVKPQGASSAAMKLPLHPTRTPTVPPTAYPVEGRPVTAPPARAPSVLPTFSPPVAPAAAYPGVATPANRWDVFIKLGLGPTATPKTNRQKTIVNAYRALGFAVLTIIVVVLIGYIATSAFYYWNSSWVEPMVVSKTDEKVLSLQAQVAAQENARDKIAADLAHAERYIEVQQTFQAEFAAAIRADLEGRRSALGRAKALAEGYAGARRRVERSNQAYANASAARSAQEYRAGLIDRDQMLSSRYQVAQITTSNLSLAEREAEFQNRAADLQKEAEALDAILNQKGGDRVLSYDVLRIKQEYQMSRLETAKAMAERDALKSAAKREDAIISNLKQSPWLRAVSDKVTVAFIPYGNMDGVEAGSPLYGCALEMFWCHEVGKVAAVLPGEVSFKHPRREKTLRGQMIEIELEGAASAEKDVLFVGGKPLGL